MSEKESVALWNKGKEIKVTVKNFVRQLIKTLDKDNVNNVERMNVTIMMYLLLWLS